MYEVGDKVEIIGSGTLTDPAWVMCTVDSVEDGILTALSDEPEEMSKKTLFAVPSHDWPVLTRKSS